MADLSITAGSVYKFSGAQQVFVAGSSFSAGVPFYADANDNNAVKPAQANSAAAARVRGISLHAATSGQPLVGAVQDAVIQLASTDTVKQGQTYWLSTNAGLVADSEPGAGGFASQVCVGTSDARLKMVIHNSSIATT